MRPHDKLRVTKLHKKAWGGFLNQSMSIFQNFELSGSLRKVQNKTHSVGQGLGGKDFGGGHGVDGYAFQEA